MYMTCVVQREGDFSTHLLNKHSLYPEISTKIKKLPFKTVSLVQLYYIEGTCTDVQQ